LAPLVRKRRFLIHVPLIWSLTLLFGFTIFLSAFLLFSLEPLIGKRILPWFGGSAAVWCTCLVFFQTALLIGYVYARWLSRVASKQQGWIHCAILLASLILLPIGPGLRWRAEAPDHPAWAILLMLCATIGLPFAALSATSPLLQHWAARLGHRKPYGLFAVSNFASLAALFAYPLFVEPTLDMPAQRWSWSLLYVLFAGVCAAVACVTKSVPDTTESSTPPTPPKLRPRLLWFALPACGSMLLLSVTNHITENVAAVPLLWILPLAVYLLTFVVAFSGTIYKRTLWLRLLAMALGVLGYAIYDINTIEAIQISLPIFLLSLFACCMFCHGELNRSRPEPSQITEFYLMIAAGGAVGAIFVGLIAPLIFNGIYELPLTLVVTALLALVVTWRDETWAMRSLWAGVTIGMVVVFAGNVSAFREDSLTLRRSFYGSLRVVQSKHAGERQTRTLFHGTIEHGAQFVLPPLRFRPTTYYGSDSGIGIVLRECFTGPKRVAVIGLGVGTIAAYGRPGDTFRFYEINRQVEQIATTLFFYLRESHARTEIVTGDARLSLEQEHGPVFDVLAIDAFSGDAVPVHLITREALQLYIRRLSPNGVVAFHVSNDYLDLASVVVRLAQDAGYGYVLVRNHDNEDDLVLASDWVLVTRNKDVLENASVKVHAAPVVLRPKTRIWTDDYNNLLQILKTPQLH
jgi:hypothetical protein